MRKLATLCLGIACVIPLFAGDAGKMPVETVHTERIAFEAGGVIRVLHSSGSLTVEGWDRPEVEVTVSKSMERYYDPEQIERIRQTLERFQIVVQHPVGNELAISTIFPPRRFTHWFNGKGTVLRGAGAGLDKVTGTVRHPLGGTGGLTLEYQVHVPRDSGLIIRHGAGQAMVSNVTGNIEVTSRGGDILLFLPESGKYSIDARSKLGAVSSDFAGVSHRRQPAGSEFSAGAPATGHRVYLRTRVGGIAIKTVPPEAEQ